MPARADLRHGPLRRPGVAWREEQLVANDETDGIRVVLLFVAVSVGVGIYLYLGTAEAEGGRGRAKCRSSAHTGRL